MQRQIKTNNCTQVRSTELKMPSQCINLFKATKLWAFEGISRSFRQGFREQNTTIKKSESAAMEIQARYQALSKKVKLLVNAATLHDYNKTRVVCIRAYFSVQYYILCAVLIYKRAVLVSEMSICGYPRFLLFHKM